MNIEESAKKQKQKGRDAFPRPLTRPAGWLIRYEYFKKISYHMR